MSLWHRFLDTTDPDPLEFSPPILRLRDEPPHPMANRVVGALALLLAALLAWALVGKLDIVAVARGKLVPQGYVKIVQPAESGIIREILTREGEKVTAGQLLIRMDAMITEADARQLKAEEARKRLALRRIDAELSGRPFRAEPNDPPELARETEAQFRANRAAQEAALAEERSRLAKARQDLAAAEAVRDKLAETLPHYRKQEEAFAELLKSHSVAPLAASDKQRERIEKEQELESQEHVMESARAGVRQAEKALTQLETDYRRKLYAERNELANALDKLTQELAKQSYRTKLLELRAPQGGVVKDLATHTIGTVVQPGTVLLTLVPKDETLRAEVWVSNEDIGFVRPGQPVKLKFMAFPFQQYGMAEGEVAYVCADAADTPATGDGIQTKANGATPLAYKALVTLKAMTLDRDRKHLRLTAGMQTNAEILLGRRTVAEYLLSPVRKAWQEAGRER